MGQNHCFPYATQKTMDTYWTFAQMISSEYNGLWCTADVQLIMTPKEVRTISFHLFLRVADVCNSHPHYHVLSAMVLHL